MVDISLNIYDQWREWIRKARKDKVSWDDIQYAGNGSEIGLLGWINLMANMGKWGDGTEIPVEVWYDIVASEKAAEEEQQEIEKRTKGSMLVDEDIDNDATISTSPGSSWQLYRKHLRVDSKFSETSVKQIEESCFRILKRLSNDTTQSGPIKGLVIGNVQSGKTANMAGLMAMAADNGWNMFIILSGTIENLRQQTETRLTNDLNSGEGNLIWEPLDRNNLKVRKTASSGQTKHLYLDNKSKRRYFAICLKNKTRLTNLIKWLQADPNAQQNLRILIIDDEADQASINTGDVSKGDEDRKAINKLIVNLVEGRKYNSAACASHYKAINYVCYTATPYANFLNENYPTSLYPKDFLIALQPSKQYFGPEQIFGTDDEENADGMNIIRSISCVDKKLKSEGVTDDFDLIEEIHENGSTIVPDSFWDSICWFLCSVAAMRYSGYKKPISMLIHTSTLQQHHANFETAVKVVLKSDRAKILKHCEQVYVRETKAFTKADLQKAYPDYERPMADVPDYPDFSKIKSGIELLLDTPVSAIPMNEDHDEFQYHAGIHLCVDNCANNGISNENTYVRLAYPADDSDPYPSPAPAFIVIGGNTLSRGLTIQGLVSTYFARNVKQADSLMQMGRWFGYRHNYELYPRLWVTDDTRKKFVFMTQLDEELREELKQYHILGKKPSDYAPRVKNSPKASFLQITSASKMQMASEVDFDFTGVRTETVSFTNDKEVLEKNLAVTEDFLHSLRGFPSDGRKGRGYVWKDVDFSLIKEKLLNKCEFTSQGKVFNQLEAFMEWIDKVTSEGNLNTWNVAVGGETCHVEDEKAWDIGKSYAVRKIRRNNKIDNKDADLLVVGAVRDPKDLVIDIDDKVLQKKDPEAFAKIDTSGYIINNHYMLRSICGYDKTPLLIIYLIDKDSAPANPNSTTRKKLDAKADVVAFSITIPGNLTGKGISQRLQITTPINEGEGDTEE